MINWTPRLRAGFKFAEDGHKSINQVRKYNGEPYFNHCLEVANIVSSVNNEEDVLIAAATHDLEEDVAPLNPNYNLSAITRFFGPIVAHFVLELTDVYTKEAYPQFNRAKRKSLERERIGQISNESKTIKLADLLSNTKSIVEHDKGFAITYIKEKLELLPYLQGGDLTLYVTAEAQANKAAQELDIRL
jgi:guanosine-3',5'-bis(diphosphate) 3'-pyrophosphohydrolase